MLRAKRLEWLVTCALVAVVLAGFWLRTQQLSALPPGLTQDEAKKIVDSAHVAQTGKIILYQDRGRPEPFYQFAGGLTSLLFGNSVWVFRFEAALWGLLTLPAVYWASRECFAEQPAVLRALLGLAAAAVVATALGHVTISRSLYRAAPLTLFLTLFAGFAARALRRQARTDYVLTAVFLALGIYCYSSALAAPFVFIPLILQLALFRRAAWRRWLPGLILFAATLLLLTAPVAYLLSAQPGAVIGRAQDVASGRAIDPVRSVESMFVQFFVRGDDNAQYNVAEAPLVDALVAPVFGIGLIYLALHPRRDSSVLILGLLIFLAIPALATNESTHGLRIYAEFAVIPLIAASGLIPLYHFLAKLTRSRTVSGYLILASVAVAFGLALFKSARTYIAFWEADASKPPPLYVYDRALRYSESFFRTDRQVLANWIKAQSAPLLLPLEELNGRSMRAYLLTKFPFVQAVETPPAFPADMLVVLPWSLERGKFIDEGQHFALMAGNTISILPPLDRAFVHALLQGRKDAMTLEFEGSNIPVVGQYFPVAGETEPVYQAPTGVGDPIARFNGELDVVRWHGPDTISAPGNYAYSLDWSVRRSVGHNYGVALQLLTPDWKGVTGEDRFLYRWLYPTSAWDASDRVPLAFSLHIEQTLAPGAYRLAAGATYVNGGLMPAESFVGDAIATAATIGWVKSPQITQPAIPPGATAVNAIFAGSFILSHVEARIDSPERVSVLMYWTAPMKRVGIDATSFLHAIDDSGALLAQSDRRPWRGQYPTHIWDGGETVLIKHSLALTQTAGVRLYTGMYTQPGFERLSAEKNGARLTDDYLHLGSLPTLSSSE